MDLACFLSSVDLVVASLFMVDVIGASLCGFDLGEVLLSRADLVV